MVTPLYRDELCTLILGDCVEVMAVMEPDSVDAIVTDPPYGLEFMGKGWDKLGAGLDEFAASDFGAVDGNSFGQPGGKHVRYGKSAKTMQAWHEAWGREAFRVAKPGANMLAFGGTRTYHRLASAIEDAGWEIRDCLVWVYASGFPKSLNLPGGLGTALKPAWEPIVMARKPLCGTVAANVQEYGTGALNIDATRIGPSSEADAAQYKANNEPWTRHGRGTGGVLEESKGMHTPGRVTPSKDLPAGRWPANLLLTDPIFDGDTPGVVGGGETSIAPPGRWTEDHQTVALFPKLAGTTVYGDSGTYSRFFLIPKAARSDREPLVRGTLEERESLIYSEKAQGPLPQQTPSRPSPRENMHPTVKPLDLMRHLVRLVTPPGGVVLDPFLGSGTTAIAANSEGFACIGIEKEREYLDIALARLAHQPLGMAL